MANYDEETNMLSENYKPPWQRQIEKNLAAGKRVVTTGEVRSALQPVRYGYLAGPALAVSDGTEVFDAGDHVALQFWGNGMIRLTEVDGHKSRMVSAASVKMYEPNTIHDPDE